jgi:hypothetical protein
VSLILRNAGRTLIADSLLAPIDLSNLNVPNRKTRRECLVRAARHRAARTRHEAPFVVH